MSVKPEFCGIVSTELLEEREKSAYALTTGKYQTAENWSTCQLFLVSSHTAFLKVEWE